ncbi:ctp synthase [Plakobranchus ocellatus]|uniref:CTP synthase (glutamine hydrolyzing) n=1 Tax=Plakobranchus ocellatus TaxID=259542 RepID=A0AAV3Z605_9GAST|nr:ctp synthase [Plakobranchus ocellatus]
MDYSNHLAIQEGETRHHRLLKEVSIVLVGKYTELSDSYASVIKALQHAALAVNHRLDLICIEAADLEPETIHTNPQRYHEAWKEVVGANSMIVPGGFDVRGTEGKILACNWARTKNIPFLGICLGLQCAVIEFSRKVLKWEDANSSELDDTTKHPVVIDMPEHNTGQMGGTMRLGKRKTLFKTNKSVLRKLYHNAEFVEERHRHRYEVNPAVVEELEENGMKFVGRSEDGERMEIMELEGHPFYVGVQYHPEYISRPMKPSPPYLGLLLASCNKLASYASRGFRSSPRMSFCEDSDEGDGDFEEVDKNDKAEATGQVDGDGHLPEKIGDAAA